MESVPEKPGWTWVRKPRPFASGAGKNWKEDVQDDLGAFGRDGSGGEIVLLRNERQIRIDQGVRQIALLDHVRDVRVERIDAQPPRWLHAR